MQTYVPFPFEPAYEDPEPLNTGAPPPLATAPWPEAVRHLSASSIGTLMRCPEQFRRRYILGERERPGAAMLQGRADHKAHEVNFSQKIDTHEDLPVADVQDAFVHSFDAALDESGGPGEVEWKQGATRDKVIDAGVKLVGAYHRNVSPGVQPIAVEDYWELWLPGLPVKLLGYCDVETPDVVIDRKIGGQAKRTMPPDWTVQGLMYALARRKDCHFHAVAASGAITGPPREPLLVPYNEARAEAAKLIVQRAAATISDLYGRYGDAEPWPGALMHTWACSYCSWKRRCSYWTGQVD